MNVNSRKWVVPLLERIKYGIRTSKTTLQTGLTIQQCHIVQINEKGLTIVHPISYFLYEKKGVRYNTLKIKGQVVSRFLNWLMETHFAFGEREARLSKLDFFKIEYYINQLVADGKSKATINQNKRVLKELLLFLLNKKIITNPTVIEESKNRLENYDRSFFDIYANPSPARVDNLIHEIHPSLIFTFLNMSFKYTNPIALGVCMQFFGGLRRGECVNLTRESIKTIGSFGEFGLEVDIKHRELRPELKDYDGKNGVKKPRTQVIFSNKLLPKFYEHHLMTYKDTTGKNALFVDGHGKPMTGHTYEYYFKRLKRIFIKKLIENENIENSTYGLHLDSKKWSTHIGRGTFSNWIAETTSNPLDVAIARGDKSIESSLSYMERSPTFLKGVNEVINKMYENAWNIE